MHRMSRFRSRSRSRSPMRVQGLETARDRDYDRPMNWAEELSKPVRENAVDLSGLVVDDRETDEKKKTAQLPKWERKDSREFESKFSAESLRRRAESAIRFRCANPVPVIHACTNAVLSAVNKAVDAGKTRVEVELVFELDPKTGDSEPNKLLDRWLNDMKRVNGWAVSSRIVKSDFIPPSQLMVYVPESAVNSKYSSVDLPDPPPRATVIYAIDWNKQSRSTVDRLEDALASVADSIDSISEIDTSGIEGSIDSLCETLSERSKDHRSQ